MGVNPLHTGELISTTINESILCRWWGCQSPSPRGTHFYILSRRSRQLLSRRVSIPSTPGNSFLPKATFTGKRASYECQSPSRRGTHFYVHDNHKDELRLCECQSPPRRGTHFYPHPYFLLILCGFPASIFGAFSRQFWKRLFFRSLQHF